MQNIFRSRVCRSKPSRTVTTWQQELSVSRKGNYKGIVLKPGWATLAPSEVAAGFITGWGGRAAPCVQTKPTAVGSMKCQPGVWAGGLNKAQNSAFLPFASFASKELGLRKVFCFKESLPCILGERQIMQIGTGLCSCSLLLNSVFLSMFAFFYPISFLHNLSILGFLSLDFLLS